jgi:hypothetical protein
MALAFLASELWGMTLDMRNGSRFPEQEVQFRPAARWTPALRTGNSLPVFGTQLRHRGWWFFRSRTEH